MLISLSAAKRYLFVAKIRSLATLIDLRRKYTKTHISALIPVAIQNPDIITELNSGYTNITIFLAPKMKYDLNI